MKSSSSRITWTRPGKLANDSGTLRSNMACQDGLRFARRMPKHPHRPGFVRHRLNQKDRGSVHLRVSSHRTRNGARVIAAPKICMAISIKFSPCRATLPDAAVLMLFSRKANSHTLFSLLHWQVGKSQFASIRSHSNKAQPNLCRP